MHNKVFVLAMFLVVIAFVPGCGGTEGVSEGSVASGEALFKQTVLNKNVGCVTCHSLDKDLVLVGPSLFGIAERAEEEGNRLGMTGEEFIIQSILEPNTVITEGFPANTMPDNWREVLSDEQVDNLVAFLLTQ